MVSLLSSPEPESKLIILWIAPHFNHLDCLSEFMLVGVAIWSKILLNWNLCALGSL